MAETTKTQSGSALSQQARQSLRKAEAGNSAAAEQLKQVRKADPGGADAAEQAASEGPEGRGLSR
ncbi:MAG: hypothetical protein B7Z80_10155 [Rhodospirillales bacterium 20-64-7]|nr:MAG: hypothetical protein B7Z80_10155 [Rhodospirillales bacterium 20-64-7]HQT76944.1 hypothetical protein [Rhodopila sp.]